VTATFKRARKPEQITARREAILAAAAALFDAEGADGAGLNAIAARAGFTKSNVYRYFESREAVLIELFLGEFKGFIAAFETALSGVAPGDLSTIAHVSAGLFTERPRLGRLLALLAGVLERNVSERAVVSLKTEMLGFSERLAMALNKVLPGVPIDDCGWLGATIGTYVSGLWPIAHPSPLVDAVMQRPEFAPLKHSAGRDLERVILTLLRGLATG
jgi:TetR/AcrR family transcriptional regulator